MNLLITGIKGYLGSVTAENLISDNKIKILGIDNLKKKRFYNYKTKKIKFFKCDYGDNSKLKEIFKNYKIDYVLHCAARTSVIESLKYPEKYYEDYVKSKRLINICKKNFVKKFIFLSSAAVYKDCNTLISENHKILPLNPYGRNKRRIELYLMKKASRSFEVFILRLFNVLGSQKKNKAGQATLNRSLIEKIYKSSRDKVFFNLNGNNHKTFDKSPVRDFFDVNIISEIIKKLITIKKKRNFTIYNVGSGKGCSVLNFLRIFTAVSGKKIRLKIKRMNKKEISTSLANCKKINFELNINVDRFKLKNSIKNHYKWLQKNLG